MPPELEGCCLLPGGSTEGTAGSNMCVSAAEAFRSVCSHVLTHLLCKAQSGLRRHISTVHTAAALLTEASGRVKYESAKTTPA